MLAAFEGRPSERFPVAVPYVQLMHREHWREIHGEEPRHYYEWLYAEPDEHVRRYRGLLEALPLDMITPVQAPPPAARGKVRVVRRGEGCFLVDLRTGAERRVRR